ncbi:hypothetical protein B1H26_41365 [Amycolatopsis sp. BJA-103]|nr:hypothetical protein B1H26_41365 [Amycolatopsis sp. BJA-103]
MGDVEARVETGPSQRFIPGGADGWWPETRAHRGWLGPVWVYAASVAGHRHTRDGAHREDSYSLASTAGAAGLAIADGVGAGRNSHAAALLAGHVAAAGACSWAQDGNGLDWDSETDKIIDEINGIIADDDSTRSNAANLGLVTGAEQPGKRHGPATTLIALAVVPSGAGLVVHWLVYGDSQVMLLSADGQWHWPAGRPPPRLTGSTPALPGKAEGRIVGSAPIAPDDVLILATDGVWPAFVEQPREFAASIRSAWDCEVSAAKFATLLDFDIPGYADDRTVIMLRAVAPGR